MKDAAPTNTKCNSPKGISENREQSKSKHFVTIKHQTMTGQLTHSDDVNRISETHTERPSVKNYFQSIKRRLDYVLNENNQLLQLTASEQKMYNK
jgi:hypothetical protein